MGLLLWKFTANRRRSLYTGTWSRLGIFYSGVRLYIITPWDFDSELRIWTSLIFLSYDKQVLNAKNRSTEGCSKLKSPEIKTSSGEIGLNNRTLASPKVGQDQVSDGVSVFCWHAVPVANVLWKPLAIR